MALMTLFFSRFYCAVRGGSESDLGIAGKKMADDCQKVLKAIQEQLMSSSLVYKHQTFVSVYMGRDLTLFLAKEKSLQVR
jgi:hypothetical protein